MFKSIRPVIFLVLTGIVLISFLLLSLIALPSIKDLAVSQIKDQLLVQANMSREDFSNLLLSNAVKAVSQEKAVEIAKNTGSRVTLINKDGAVLADSDEPLSKIKAMENHLTRPEVVEAASGKYGSSIRYSETTRRDQIYLALALREKNGRILGYLRMSDPSEYIPKITLKFYRSLALALLLALAVCVITSYFISMIFTRPLRRLVETSEKISEGRFPATIMKKSWFEIGSLERAVEKMSLKLSDLFNNIKKQQGSSGAVFSGMKEGVVVLDKDGKIHTVNPAVEKIFGLHGDDLTGKTVLEVLRNNEIAAITDRSIKLGKEIEEEIDILTPVEASFAVYAGPIKDKDGDIFGGICVLHDITKLKKLERYRSEFVANISHELKTPLTAIKNYAETLLNSAPDDKEKSREFILKIEKHSDNLSSLIDDILELSRLESGVKSGEPKSVNISEVISRSVELLLEKANKKGIVINVECDGQLSIRSIKDHLFRAVSNLIDNAVNYSEKDSMVSIKCVRKDNNIEISVSDNGIGIPKENIGRIFERFYRVDPGRSRDSGGTGLGLSIVKHIMELHGGRVSVQSEAGKGSTFTLIFPL
ncbi:MAG: ATP-binding protein [Candidatus Saganbacteria bacterium]|nr:ATP-binding protein [Candidatus Saganbacteria bacterium]